MARCYDAIVIGAGPAGTTAAIKLAEAGYTVLLLERRKLPRDKPCAGGLTPKAATWLPVPIDDLVLHRADRVRVRCGPKIAYRFKGHHCAVWMIRRRELDLRLAEEASRLGVEIHDEEPATGLEIAGEATVATDRGSYSARAVIGADGAESRVARWVGLERPRRWMITLSSDVEIAGDPLAGEIAIDLSIPNGYGWVFPKSDHYSIGLASLQPACARVLRSMYRRFAEDIGITSAKYSGQIGRRIPTGLTPGPLHRDNAILIGDAAGVADPFFGEGISYAALSGRIAAQAVADYLAGQSPSLSTYTHRIKSAIKASMRFWGIVAAVVHRFPGISLQTLAASPRLQNIAERAIAGDIAFLHPLC